MNGLRGISRRYAVFFVLAAMVVAVFWRVGGYPFICYDDDRYILKNDAVRDGLTPAGVRWAFTSDMDAGRIPLTWISRMADVSLFGMDAGMHHLVNVLLHLLSTWLLFHVLRRTTGKSWESGLVAALFAIHPLHVESVAWVTERKDVLAGFFWMLSLWAYARYAEKPGAPRYGLLALFFSLGLASKATAVTLPFVLLLMDFWPLGRYPAISAGRLLGEKAPLFLLSLAVSALTYWSQARIGAVSPLDLLPLWARAGNAVQAYTSYVARTGWPSGLAVFYPHPETGLTAWKVAAAAAFLGVVSAWVVGQRRSRAWLAAGWFWFLGTLVPVLGLVHVGSQAMADRCTYIPLIGLFIMCAWGSGELAERRIPANAVAAAWAAGLLALMACSWVQVGYWRDSETLFKHAIDVTGDNWGAQNGLGVAAAQAGRDGEAVARFGEAVRLMPDIPEVRKNLAASLVKAGRPEEAATQFREALRQRPGDADAAYALYVILSMQGNRDEAMGYFAQGMRDSMRNAAGSNDMGMSFARAGKINEAAACFREALRLQPDHAEAHYNLGVALTRLGRKDEAMPHFREALRMPAVDADSHNKIGVALLYLGRLEGAEARFRKALRIQPGHPDATLNLAKTLRRMGRRDDAEP